jgi:tetratricopeptide (TPR) repeat protein
VKHFAVRSRRLAASIFSLFLLPLAGTAQEKPKTKPPAPHQQIQKQTAGAALSKAQKDPVEERYRAAETFQLAGDFKSAETEYRRVISLALQRMAAIRILAQDNPQALVFLQSATAANPSDLDAQMSLASLYLRSGDLARAKPILLSVLAQSKDEHQLGAKNMLGKISFMEGDYAAAADQLKAAWAESPDIDVAYSLALTYLKLNQVANAANLFDEMLTSLGSSAELHVLIGRAYQEGSQFDLAAEEFRKALKLDPAVARAHSYLGTVYLLQRGDAAAKDAQGEFEAELAHNPSDYSSHFHLGVLHFKQHDLGLAELELNKAIHLQPSSPEAYFYLAQAQMEAGNSQASLEQFEKAIQLYGSASRASQPVHEAYSKALERLGKHELAQHELDTARELSNSNGKAEPGGVPAGPKSDDEIRAVLIPPVPNADTKKIPREYLTGLKEALGNAYHNLGVILAQRSQYEDAANLFAEAAKWSPDIKALDKNWGTASFRANQYKMAIAPLERHILADPQDANARQMLALSYFMTDDFPKAAAAFRPILPTLPDNPSLLYAAGIALAKSGDSNGASEIFQRMLVQNPDSAEVHLFLGQAHAEQKEDVEALKEFSRALELNAKLPEANYSAGMIHLRQGNREQAESDFRAELAVNPGDASAEYRLGYILLAEQKQAEAIEMLGDVVRQKPNDADAHYGLGKALLEKGDVKPAIERLEAAVRLDPGQPNAYYQLSLAYRRQGRAQEAETTLRQYEKLKEKKPRATSESESVKPR